MQLVRDAVRARGPGSRGRLAARFWLAAIVAVLLAPVGSSALAAAAAAKNPDPWQGLNRKIFEFNDFMDRYLLKPAAQGYDFVMPNPMQRGVSNAFDNIGTPWIAANEFLQGKPRRGLSDLLRFAINSTLGVAGLFDVASHAGMDKYQEDFGQTLSVWGVARGPYFVIPLRGPSTVTDAVGLVVDAFFNPILYIKRDRTRYGVLALSFIEQRARLLDAESLISGDKYIFIRDAYLQRREFLIKDGQVESDPFVDEDFDYEE
ncbi:MAG: VacJ family lipoprotein [Acidobacteriota bacterium]|jgi:phospholipid-binding lipoprotein MlaA